MRTAIIPPNLESTIKSNPSSDTGIGLNKQPTRIIEFFPGRISLSEVKAIWNDEEEFHTDEELLQIRDWLYMVAELSMKIFSARNDSHNDLSNSISAQDEPEGRPDNLVSLNPTTTNDEGAEESNFIHPSFDRRAS